MGVNMGVNLVYADKGHTFQQLSDDKITLSLSFQCTDCNWGNGFLEVAYPILDRFIRLYNRADLADDLLMRINEIRSSSELASKSRYCLSNNKALLTMHIPSIDMHYGDPKDSFDLLMCQTFALAKGEVYTPPHLHSFFTTWLKALANLELAFTDPYCIDSARHDKFSRSIFNSIKMLLKQNKLHSEIQKFTDSPVSIEQVDVPYPKCCLEQLQFTITAEGRSKTVVAQQMAPPFSFLQQPENQENPS